MKGGEAVRKAVLVQRFRRIVMMLIAGALLALFALMFLRAYYPFPYRESVERYALEYQIDPLLIASIMRVESSFNPHAVSPKGARGLMQLMPETAQWVASQMDMEEFDVDMLFDPEVNVAMGAWYLADLRRLFDGHTVLALAAYNGGRGNVRRWLSEQAWSGEVESLDDIPFPETRAYVDKVLSTYTMYRWVWGRSIHAQLAL